jgi:hemerythrin-like domain-containing protein
MQMTPTEILSDEHRLIVAVLDSLEEAAEHLDSGDAVSPEYFLDAAEFVAGFADRCHHAKEEDILFVAMTAIGMPRDSGPVAVMLREHDEGRQYTAAFRSAAEQMKSGDGSAAADVVCNVFNYVYLMREHINKEDNVLFPMAAQIIPADTMQQVSSDFQRVMDEDAKNGILAKYQALAEKLSRDLNKETSAA